MISEEVLSILDIAARLNGRTFNDADIDGGVESVCVSCEEDYLVAMAYIAECNTFRRNIDLEAFNLKRERGKMVDILLQILAIE